MAKTRLGKENKNQTPVRSVLGYVLATILLVVLGILAYEPGMHSPFIFDDSEAVTENPAFFWFNPKEGVYAQTSLAGRPVVAVTMALNTLLGGKDPFGYHLFNTFLHIANTWLLLLLVDCTLRTTPVGKPLQSYAFSIALVTSLVWLLHPLVTESVTYVTSRTELMVVTWYLATLYAAARAWDGPASLGWAVAAVVFCILGMGSKEVMVSAPLAVVAYDIALRGASLRSFPTLLRQRRWLYAGLAATWIILVAINASMPRSRSVGFGHGVTALDYLLAQTEALLIYFKLSFWPSALCADYGYVEVPDTTTISLGAALAIAWMLLALWGWWKCPWVGFLATVPAMVLAPTTSFIPVVTQVAAERRMYLPLAFIILGVILAGHWLWRVLSSSPRRNMRVARRVLIVGLLAVLIASMVVTRRRNFLYNNPPALWNDTIAKRPQNPRAHHMLGETLQAMQVPAFLPRVIQAYKEAIRLHPDYAQAYNNMGVAYAQLQRYDVAIEQYEKALSLEPEYVAAIGNLAAAKHQLGENEVADELFRRVMEVAPHYYKGYLDYGLFLGNMKDYQAAVPYLEKAVELNPYDFSTRRALAGTLAAAGDTHRALEELTRCAKEHPENVDAWIALARLLLHENKLSEAQRVLIHLMKLDSQNPVAVELMQELRRRREEQ